MFDSFHQSKFAKILILKHRVTASTDRSLDALTELEEPAKWCIARDRRHSRQIHFASRGEIRTMPWVLRRIPDYLPDSLKITV